MARIPHPHTTLWPRHPPEQENPSFPYFSTRESTSSPPIWSIRHSYHPRTTIQRLHTIHQPLATQLWRHCRRPSIPGVRRTDPPPHALNPVDCRWGDDHYHPTRAPATEFFALGHHLQLRADPSAATGPMLVTKLQGSLRQVTLHLEHQHHVLHHPCRTVYEGMQNLLFRPLENAQENTRRPLRKSFHSPLRPPKLYCTYAPDH